MELVWLEDFAALAQTENFSRAATLRHISQPAFSRRIQALENWLGIPLFIRDAHRVSLTAAGQEFKVEAAALIRDIYRIRKNVMDTATKENATLLFAATHTISTTFFPRWISQHEVLGAPNDIYLTSDTLQTCEEAFIQGQVQFLLSYYHPSDVPLQNYPHCLVGQDVLVPLCAPQNKGQPLWKLPGSSSHPVRLLRYSQASGLSRILENIPSNKLFSQQSQFTSHLASVLFSLACEGKGIAWLPLSLAEQALKEKKLVRAGIPQWDVAIEIRLYRRLEKLHHAAENFWQSCLSQTLKSFQV